MTDFQALSGSHTFGSKNTTEKFQEYFAAKEDTLQWE
jgi:hypothetical protein